MALAGNFLRAWMVSGMVECQATLMVAHPLRSWIITEIRDAGISCAKIVAAGMNTVCRYVLAGLPRAGLRNLRAVGVEYWIPCPVLGQQVVQ